MAWLPDEIHDFYEDCKEKKSTAQSARHARTHCGKGGAVKFASDYMTKKEREAMNGECKSYRMNDPISWEEFKTWPDEHKITYVKLLRKKYNVPDSALAGAWGLCKSALTKPFAALGLNKGEGNGARKWDKEGFYAWWHGAKAGAVKPSETPIEEEEDVECETTEATDELVAVNEEPEIEIVEDLLGENNNDRTCSYASDCKKKMIRDAGPIAFLGNSMPVIPRRGTLTFDNNVAEDALETVKTLLGSMRVSMSITWFPIE